MYKIVLTEEWWIEVLSIIKPELELDIHRIEEALRFQETIQIELLLILLDVNV